MAADPRAAAEVAFRAVIDAQRADLALLRARWPDRESLESRAALDRLAAAAAPDGDADRTIAAVHAAYGGYDRVPEDVRARMERYVWEHLGERPWPARDPAEAPAGPVLGRPRRRATNPQEAPDRGR